jgi:hypothetical protein
LVALFDATPSKDIVFIGPIARSVGAGYRALGESAQGSRPYLLV